VPEDEGLRSLAESEAETLSEADHTLQVPVGLPWVDMEETSSQTGVVRLPSMTSEYALQPCYSENVSTTADVRSVLTDVTGLSS
jgi:hypothetical protein